MSTHPSNLISIEWLNANLDLSDIVILDATMKKKPNGEPIPSPAAIIPGARAFNFDTEICDQKTDLPHMLCTAEEFEIAAINLGINANSKIIIYDAMGIFSSPRAWWMFKIMGHQNVFVLDGGLPIWIDAGYPTKTQYSKASSIGNFKAYFKSEQVFSNKQILDNLDNASLQILDARSRARFNGLEPEPREELKGGHIPNSSCLPFTDLLSNGFMKDKEQLANCLESVIREPDNQLVFSCGSGVTACILALAADECGYQNTVVYDGSWSEWGAEGQFPIES